MSFLTSLVSAFKGGGGARVPVSRGFVSPWSHWGATAFDGGPPGRSPFDYAREVGEAYLANPVAQRAVRIVRTDGVRRGAHRDETVVSASRPDDDR